MKKIPCLKMAMATLLTISITIMGCSKAEKNTSSATNTAQAPVVDVQTVHFQAIPLVKQLSGKVVAYQQAVVVPQVSGIIDKQFFREGSFVEKGQNLYQINPDNYASGLISSKASYNQAIASIETAEANLQSRHTELELAKVKLQRLETLKDSNAISQQEYDVGVASVATAKANLANAKAQLNAAKASKDVAQQAINSHQLNYNRTMVKAPISGVTSLSNVNIGALATAGQTQLVHISQLNPIYINIQQSAAELLALRQSLTKGDVSLQNSATLTLTLADGSLYPAEGQLLFEEAKVDETTGTMNLRAIFRNDEYILLPGMSVNAQITQGMINRAVLLPQSAMIRTPKGDTLVNVVDHQQKIQARPVTVHGTYQGKWIVTQGLQDGEQVVIAGGSMLKPEQTVTVKPIAQTDDPSTMKPQTTENPQTKLQNPKVAPSADTPTERFEHHQAPKADETPSHSPS